MRMRGSTHVIRNTWKSFLSLVTTTRSGPGMSTTAQLLVGGERQYGASVRSQNGKKRTRREKHQHGVYILRSKYFWLPLPTLRV